MSGERAAAESLWKADGAAAYARDFRERCLLALPSSPKKLGHVARDFAERIARVPHGLHR
jgi:hypothetical protein